MKAGSRSDTPDTVPSRAPGATPEEYCRAIEAYLCRRNGGHLVRIVGPSFDCVRGWAEQGIPIKIAMQGIDRCVDRYEAKGGRRRPVRVEFCDGDVLDCFDAWRRAIGVPRSAAAGDAGDASPVESRKPGPLRTHVDRVIARLTVLCGGESRVIGDLLDPIVRELDAIRPGEGALRGAARARVESRLRTLDADLLRGARRSCAEILPELTREAEEELAPYRERLSSDDYARARQATLDRLVRTRLGLPTLSYE